MTDIQKQQTRDKLKKILNNTEIPLSKELIKLKDDLNNNNPIPDSLLYLMATIFLILETGGSSRE